MSGWFAQLVQEVLCELVLPLLQHILSDIDRISLWDVQTVLSAADKVKIEEVHNFAGVLPSPSAQNSWTVSRVDCIEVVK